MFLCNYYDLIQVYGIDDIEFGGHQIFIKGDQITFKSILPHRIDLFNGQIKLICP